MELLLARLRAAGFEAESVRAAPGGVVASAGMARLRDGSQVFAKTLRTAASDLFEIEAAGCARCVSWAASPPPRCWP
ncbi:hypothetical protein ACFQQB_20730 [Nonomuraea rubra]|uniref:hypothetical protein n=1 Tax=Nonomuraea rubra TaxID=46180 RepID=UPI003611A705